MYYINNTNGELSINMLNEIIYRLTENTKTIYDSQDKIQGNIFFDSGWCTVLKTDSKMGEELIKRICCENDVIDAFLHYKIKLLDNKVPKDATLTDMIEIARKAYSELKIKDPQPYYISLVDAMVLPCDGPREFVFERFEDAECFLNHFRELITVISKSLKRWK